MKGFEIIKYISKTLLPCSLKTHMVKKDGLILMGVSVVDLYADIVGILELLAIWLLRKIRQDKMCSTGTSGKIE